MNLTPEQQQKVVSMLGCLVESAKQHDHVKDCDCQLCMDLRSADDLLSEVDPEYVPV